MAGRWISAFVLACCVGSTPAQDDKIETRRNADWLPIARQSVSLPQLDALPQGGAGCLVVGYYILADGTTARARIMQGAYTRATPETVQATFGEAALAAAHGWRFRYEGRFIRPIPKFERTVVGYSRAGNGSETVITMGVDAQDSRVRTACGLDDLGTWGTRHALPAKESPAQDKVLFPYAEPSEAFWSAIGEMTPPRYPPEVFQSGIEGCVVVGMLVGSDGVPDQFRIMESSTSKGKGMDARKKKLLENASVSAMSRWRFAPGPDNPGRIPAFLQIPVDFTLDRPPSRTDCQPKEISKS